MKYELVFDDWRQEGNVGSIYSTPLGIELSSGDLHSGTVFDVEITFEDKEAEQEIQEAMKEHGAYPMFRVISRKP